MTKYIISQLIVVTLPLMAVLGLAGSIWLLHHKKRVLSGLLLACVGLGAYAHWIEPNRLIVRERALPYSFAEPLRVALISDLHLGGYSCANRVQAWADAVNELAPDVVLIAGDFVWGMKDEAMLTACLAPLQDLAAPTYAVLGNHDQPSQGELPPAIVQRAVESANVQVIDNTLVPLAHNENTIQLVGLGDAWNTPYPDALIENLADAPLTLALTHNPDRAYEIHKPARIDLLMAGHTHGGQVWVPQFLKSTIIPTTYPFDRGLSLANGIPTYVSSGLGTGGLPVRLGVVPEVVLITFGG